MDAVNQLIQCLTPSLEQQGFYCLESEHNFVQDTPDFINMFVIYDSYTQPHSFSVRVAIQAKAVEAVVSDQLGRPRLLPDEATIGQAIKLENEASWLLNSETDIPAVSDKLLQAFAAAQEFFCEHNSIPKIAEHLLRQPVYPVTSQKILACAFLLHDRTLLDDTKQRLEAHFPKALDPDTNVGVRTEYLAFQDMYRKLAQVMGEHG